MSCQCQGIEKEFSQKVAEKDLQSYLTTGPPKTTQLLINALGAKDVQGLTLLDIGGGVGVIQYELLKAGIRQVISVEASTAYLEVAKKEAGRRGEAGRVKQYHGDFVALAKEIPSADIVTLDRVICCYDDMRHLVNLSSARARRYYAVVYPRDRWWMKVFARVLNVIYWLRKHPFRIFVYPTQAVEAIIQKNGFELSFNSQTLIWQVKVFARTSL